MQYQIQGQPYPVVVLTVEPEETVLCQKGAMAWMTPNMEMQTKGGKVENLLLWGSVVVLLLFGIVRNLPHMEFLLPSYLQ